MDSMTSQSTLEHKAAKAKIAVRPNRRPPTRPGRRVSVFWHCAEIIELYEGFLFIANKILFCFCVFGV